MNIGKSFNLWLKNANEDPDLVSELDDIAVNNKDKIAELLNDQADEVREVISSELPDVYERFYTELKFGTAGLRGIIGAGTNRMNIYTVRRATQGLADFLNKKYESPAVAISYDSRIKSDVFAKEAACVLAANGVKAYISTELQPTPVVSFAVRELKTQAGIMVTASHNPAKYNGYKCYGSDGCQMTDVNANAVFEEIEKVDYFDGSIKLVDFEKGLEIGMIEWISDDLYEKYLENVQAQSVNPGICKGSGLKVVYTPLNGAGNKLVRKILARNGVEDVVIVPEQEMPDGNFTTCPYPNPEIQEALALGLELCEKEQPDLLLATDPDSDRVGIAVKVDNGYRLMSGNETGIMLMNYILSCRMANGTLPEEPVAVKTIVTSKLVDKVCEKYGCDLKNVLTGFKYIGEQILLLENKNQENRYVFGFEESYGYLAGSYVRDKDAVVASMLICEMAAYYRTKGKSLNDVMNELYDEFGYYFNKTVAFEFEGSAGMQKMADIMSSIRASHPAAIAGFNVTGVSDYLESYSMDLDTKEKKTIDLPKSNVLSYSLQGGGAAIVRPSGTEPKIKIYITAVGTSEDDARNIADKMIKSMTEILGIA